LKCDICDQEFANSEELTRHKERVHPMGEGDGEMPDMMKRPAMNGDMTEAEDVPEPAERRNR
jgi:hypothetical protein